MSEVKSPPVRGRIIEVAGIDGSGKSTLAEALAGIMIARGETTYVRSFHSWVRRASNAIAAKRGLQRGEYIGHDAVEFAVAMEISDRSRHLATAIADGTNYVLDPYVACSAAVAAAHGVTNLASIVDVYATATLPELVVYLRIMPELAYERIMKRRGLDNVVLRSGPSTLHAYERGFSIALEALRGAGVPIAEFDATVPIPELAAAVLEQMPR
jgi:thymidylate kinase